ncbi:MAG TPA: class II aldolase [Spongiibacteraceae bacterium]|nr:class II aldolase [Spongiibacteraceae bacterium]HCS26987.1 class II aldolase [Spongiibacteraceae bacterium]
MTFASERQSLCEALHALSRSGLSPGSTGNASVRVEGGMLISPTGLACADIDASQLVFVNHRGEVPGKQLRPSSEWHMHLAIYRSTEKAGGIVHCHSRYATTLASLRKVIPAYHYMIAVGGGDNIRCADYATFGTEALARNILVALENRKACLMANHGQIAYDSTIEKALSLAIQLEDLAAGYYQAQTLGEPFILGEKEMAEVLEKFDTYGEQAGF